MSNDSYSPSVIVRQMHQVPHLDSSWSEQNGDFDITVDSTWNDYTKSLLTMPIICMAIGLLAVFIFQFTLCCYCCCKKKPLTHEPVDRRAPNAPLRNCWIAFTVFFVAVLVYDQSIIFGNKYLSNGVSNANDGLDYIQSTFTNLNNYADALNTDGYRLQADFSSSYNINNCAAANGLNSYIDDYFGYIEDYQSYVEDVPGKCSDAQDALHTYAVDYKNKSVWVFYGMFLVCLAIYLIGMVMSSSGTAFVGIFCTDLVMWFAFIICGVAMIVLMLLADFCMEPTDNLLMIAPDSIYNVTSYYMTCVGENPMQSSLDSAQSLATNGKLATQAVLATTCQNDVYLQDAVGVFDEIQAILLQIELQIACPPNQAEVLSVLNEGLCGDSFKGIYVIWLAMFVCAAGLFALTVTVACAYPHFYKPPTAAAGAAEGGHHSPLRPAGSAPIEEEAHAHYDEPAFAQASPVPEHEIYVDRNSPRAVAVGGAGKNL